MNPKRYPERPPDKSQAISERPPDKSQAFFRAASGEIPGESWCTHRKNRSWRVLTKKKEKLYKLPQKTCVGHLRTVGYAAQVLQSDIRTAPPQDGVGDIGLGIPRPHRGPQGLGC